MYIAIVCAVVGVLAVMISFPTIRWFKPTFKHQVACQDHHHCHIVKVPYDWKEQTGGHHT